MQDLNDKLTGGTLSAAEWNQVPTEIQNVIESLTQVLTDSDLNQLGKAIVGYAGAGTWYSEIGVADAYVSNPIGGKQGPAFLNADHDGLLVRFRPGNNNTGASTLNLNALGLKNIIREDGSPLIAGDLVTTRDAFVRYNQATDDFRLQNFAISGSLEVPRGYIDGLILSNAADTANDITCGVGVCRDNTNLDTMQLSSALTKQIDVDWVAGNDAGGFPSLLTLTFDTWYHFFLIKHPGTGVVDCGFDSSLTAANLLTDATGYTLFNRIGAVLFVTGSTIKQFEQTGDVFTWQVSISDVSITNPGTGAVVHTLDHVPFGLPILADIIFVFSRPDSSARTQYKVGPGTQTIDSPDSVDRDASTEGDSRHASVSIRLLTDSVATVQSRQDGSNSNAELTIQTHGWTDPRGKDV